MTTSPPGPPRIDITQIPLHVDTVAMSRSRFAPSKYKNQLLDPAKLEHTFTELPAITPVVGANAHSLAAGSQHIALSLGTAQKNPR
jgi:hypothetical protein